MLLTVNFNSNNEKRAKQSLVGLTLGADAIKKLTPNLGIPYLGV
jgi:hypothetical protein